MGLLPGVQRQGSELIGQTERLEVGSRESGLKEPERGVLTYMSRLIKLPLQNGGSTQ